MDGTIENGGKVVRLSAYRGKIAPQMLRQVEGYWDGLRNGRLVPNRADVYTRGLSGALANTFLLERIAPGLTRVRVAGRHLSDLMGMEIQGMPFSTLFLPEARDALADALSAVLDEPAIVTLDLESPTGIGRKALQAQTILLPLKNDLGDVSRVLACLVTEGPIGRTPRRFCIRDQQRRTLIGYAEPPMIRKVNKSDVDAARPAGRKPAPVLRLVPRD